MIRFPEVAGYQVRHTRAGIEADIVAAGGISGEGLRRRLAEALAHSGSSSRT